MSAGFGADLWKRFGTALVVLPLLLTCLLLGPPSLGVAIVAAAVLIGTSEFFDLIEAAAVRPLRWAGTAAVVGLFLEAALPRRAPLLGPGVLVLLLAVALSAPLERSMRVPAAASTLLGAAYLGSLGGTMAALRVMEPLSLGGWRMVLLLGIVMGADTTAYFVGRIFGRNALAPGLSPGKTVEGALGGLLGGALGGLWIRGLGLPGIPAADALLLGLVVAVLSEVGDLFESLLKRWAGLKDSGRLFPGHGGMLDRLDSLLFGAPVLYYYFALRR